MKRKQQKNDRKENETIKGVQMEDLDLDLRMSRRTKN